MKKADYSIIEYVENAKPISQDSPFNEVDGLVLSQIANLKLEDCGIDIDSGKSATFSDIFEIAKGKYEKDSNEYLLMEKLATSERFSGMKVSNFVENPANNNVNGFENVPVISDIEQFAAVTITFEENGQPTNYMSFRATDGSVDGWIENFMMLISGETQAQQDSVAYMNIVGSKLEGDIIGGGHSKGGNDFEYGYLFCNEDVAKKIKAAYLYDSPGLDENVLKKTNRYEELMKTTDAGAFICPENAVVGTLLQEIEDAKFVPSVESEILSQHDAYSWQVKEDGTFVEGEQSALSKYLDEAMDLSVDSFSTAERIDAVCIAACIVCIAIGNEGIKEGIEKGFFDKDKISLENIYIILSSVGIASSLNPITFAFLVAKILFCFSVTALKYQLLEEDEKIENGIYKLYDSLFEKYEDNEGNLKAFFAAVYGAYVDIRNGFSDWCKKHNIGYIYYSSDSFIEVNTDLLYSYADRLRKVNIRINSLDNRLDNLRWKVDIQDFFDLLYADMLTSESWRVNKCIDYLNSTANDFVEVERNIGNSL